MANQGEDLIGQQFGNYRLVSLLGQGGFADVYLGEHVHLRTQAAIKILRTRLTSDDREKFLTEARTIAHLEHPNIIRVWDFGVENGLPYLVMARAFNGTLRQRYPKGSRLTPEEIIPYVKQVADALHYAHGQRVVHRDVKPENMLLGKNQEVLLSDFGIAFVTQSSRYQNTQDVVGTVAYMAPEQLQGKPSPASDQYALGIVVYEWLCGERPFQGSFLEIFGQHMSVPPPSLCERNPAVPPAVEQALFVALAKNPQARFGNIKAFANALENALADMDASTFVRPLQQPTPAPGSLSAPPAVSSISTFVNAPQQTPAPSVTPPPRSECLNIRAAPPAAHARPRLSLRAAGGFQYLHLRKRASADASAQRDSAPRAVWHLQYRYRCLYLCKHASTAFSRSCLHSTTSSAWFSGQRTVPPTYRESSAAICACSEQSGASSHAPTGNLCPACERSASAKICSQHCDQSAQHRSGDRCRRCRCVCWRFHLPSAQRKYRFVPFYLAGCARPDGYLVSRKRRLARFYGPVRSHTGSYPGVVHASDRKQSGASARHQVCELQLSRPRDIADKRSRKRGE